MQTWLAIVLTADGEAAEKPCLCACCAPWLGELLEALGEDPGAE